MNKYLVWTLVILASAGFAYWAYQEGKKKPKAPNPVIAPGMQPLVDPAEIESGTVVE